MLDGYNRSELKRMCQWLWCTDKAPPEKCLRTLLDLLLGHFFLMRGELRRGAQLADLFTLTLENEGPTTCHALVMLFSGGKTNVFGRAEYMGCIRNKDVWLCPISAIACYFFWRFHCVGESFPNFCERKNWYDTVLLVGDKSHITQPLSYGTQLRWINRVFEGIQITSGKKTHATRGSGARDAEIIGTSEHQVTLFIYIKTLILININ